MTVSSASATSSPARPGAYSPQLNLGFRLENTYLVTGDGCEVLTTFPFKLGR